MQIGTIANTVLRTETVSSLSAHCILYPSILYTSKYTVAFRLKKIMHSSFSPILAKTAGVATVLRFPSSARFDEFPVLGKSFPFRKTINCSLQVELSTDCQAEDWEKTDCGKWTEATATAFCTMRKKKKHLKCKSQQGCFHDVLNSCTRNVCCLPFPTDWKQPKKHGL